MIFYSILKIWLIFSLVVNNLYPFVKTVSKEGITVPDAVEQIDIGTSCVTFVTLHDITDIFNRSSLI